MEAGAPGFSPAFSYFVGLGEEPVSKHLSCFESILSVLKWFLWKVMAPLSL
jgi:hypothetical protein